LLRQPAGSNQLCEARAPMGQGSAGAKAPATWDARTSYIP